MMKKSTYVNLKLAVAGAVLAANLASPQAHAEGSKNLTPGTGTRGTATGANNFVGYLQHDDGGNSQISSSSKGFLKPDSDLLERLYIHVRPGETLYYGVRRINAGNNNTRLRLELKRGNGNNNNTITTYLSPASGTNLNNATLAVAAGVINTPEEAAIGPKYQGGTAPAGGYTPLTYTNTTNAAQDVWIEFEQVELTGNNPAVISSKSYYDCWDFTVRDSGGEKPGRLYSSAWSFSAGSFANQFATTFALYPLIPNPNFNNQSFFVKQVSYARMRPFGTLLTANKFGTGVDGTDYKLRRKSQPTSALSLGYAEYKMFVNDPDNAVYPSTIPPNSPTITTTCTGTAPNRRTVFNLAVDQAGFGLIFIDGNNSGTYEATADRVLEGTTRISNTANVFEWDGTTDSGARVPAGNISLVFSSGVGPVNFPMYDCEAADEAGITVRSVRPGNNNGFIDFLFYDDTNLDPNFSTPIRNPIGDNTPSGSHKWGRPGLESGPLSGDTKTINSYAVGLLAQGKVLNVAYDGSGCILTTPVVLVQPLPVSLTHFGAALQKDGVRLNWETATERNNAYFAVERSADGRNFEEVTRVAGSGTSSQNRRYATLDPAPLAGASYYRLRQVDTDGAFNYSPVAAVSNEGRGVATLFPNPATTEVKILFANPLSGPVDIQIMDAAGRVVWQEHREQAGNNRQLDVPTAQLPANSLYFVQVRNGGDAKVYRFSK
ncbi:T9SS type A sorting domain-containing protein [Hymenobacter arizonensis]|uniref:Por secretion system C-terminal sorting domain-containing protein n=1 Tax=Hymenobacter arizonensis TaxID=1227077 RepID=A0A1I5Z4R9_HYMAR|nr:T9SS type A sorting domain-containing protein [Hymenobacter arizonensis]SFQ51458.1 Por secretion system C-terminal sorting domain-containing protein [Hymenobacter arizonensis]